MRLRLLLLATLSVTIAACSKDAAKNAADAGATPASSASTVPAAKAASSDMAPAGSASGAIAADASGVLALKWKAVNAGNAEKDGNENVIVSAVVGDETLPLGQLNAASDDAPGSVATCAMRGLSPTQSTFTCGGTPAYNFYTAKLAGGALVISLTTGVDGVDGSEKVKEVARRPTNATSLRPTGPASPALYGNCRVGYVQKTSDGPCMRQCLKGNECKGKDTCQFVTVKGTDGDHKVHACVPPGK